MSIDNLVLVVREMTLQVIYHCVVWEDVFVGFYISFQNLPTFHLRGICELLRLVLILHMPMEPGKEEVSTTIPAFVISIRIVFVVKGLLFAGPVGFGFYLRYTSYSVPVFACPPAFPHDRRRKRLFPN